MKPIYKYNNKNSTLNGQFVEIIKLEEKLSKVRFVEFEYIREAWVFNDQLELIEDLGTGLDRSEKLWMIAVLVFLIGLVWLAFQLV